MRKLLTYLSICKMTKSSSVCFLPLITQHHFPLKKLVWLLGGLRRVQRPRRKFSIFHVSLSDSREATKKEEQQWLKLQTRTSESKSNRKGRMGRYGPVQPEVNWPQVQWSNLPDDMITNQRPLQFISGSQTPQKT